MRAECFALVADWKMVCEGRTKVLSEVGRFELHLVGEEMLAGGGSSCGQG